MKVRLTVTVDLEVMKQNEPLVGLLFNNDMVKSIVEESILKKVKDNFVYEGFDLEHNVDIKVID